MLKNKILYENQHQQIVFKDTQFVEENTRPTSNNINSKVKDNTIEACLAQNGIYDKNDLDTITSTTTKISEITGRRIIDIAHFWNQLTTFHHHPFFNCNLQTCKIISEKCKGFISIFNVKCEVCGAENKISTDKEGGAGGDINSAAVLGKHVHKL